MPHMHAMVLERLRAPLMLRERPVPRPGPGEVLVEVKACGVCRTDLHVVDGELPDPKLPIVPGHDRHSLARLDLRNLPVLPQRAREPVRPAAVHRLHP